jgi:zinc protease
MGCGAPSGVRGRRIEETSASLKHILPNGLTLLLKESHNVPVVALQAWVKFGSAHEPEELAGVAHVIEHMMFKGTEKRGVADVARQIEGAGGDINAWTSYDETVYHLVVPSRKFALGLDVLADAIQNSNFDAGELKRELDVVLEEIRQGEDEPGHLCMELLFKHAFKNHPFHRPIIGYRKTVARLDRTTLKRVHRAQYNPANILLTVAGDVNEQEVLRAVKSRMGDARGKGASPDGMPVPVQRNLRVNIKPQPVDQAYVGMAFHLPGLKHPDTAALDVLSVILGQGDSCRLYSSLKRRKQLVTDVYAYSYAQKELGLMVVGATAPPKRFKPAMRALLSELTRPAWEDVPSEELAKAARVVKSDAVYSGETAQGQARKLGYYHLKVFPDKRAGAATLKNWVADTVKQTFKKAASKRPLPRVKPGRGGMLKRVLDSGAKLVVLPDDSVPLVAFRAVWLGGVRGETSARNGITNLLAGTITRGTESRPSDQVFREMEAMGGSLTAVAGRNSFGLRAEVLSGHWEEGLELLADCSLHPRLDPEELDRQRQVVLHEMEAQQDNLALNVFRLFRRTLYGRHPYGMPLNGTPKTVASVTAGQLNSFHRKHCRPEDLVLSVVGDVDPPRVVTAVSRWFGRRSGRAGRPLKVAEPADIRKPRRAHLKKDKQQAHIVLGFPGLRITDEDRFALEVLTTVLSGQGGRLFVELRDRQGLAYRVSASCMEGLNKGYFSVYMATEPRKTAVAVEGIRGELEKVRSRRVGKMELNRVKNHMVGTHAISLQRRAALASTMALNELYGLGYDEHLRYPGNIAKVTSSQLLEVARRYLDPEKEVLAVASPRAKL